MIDEITKAESFRSSCFTFSERIKDAKVWLSTRPQKVKEKKKQDNLPLRRLSVHDTLQRTIES